MTRTQISVVVVTHNHRTFVPDALLALFRQSYSDAFQIVVSDDASTDGTDFEIRNLAKLSPPHIQLTTLLGRKRIGPLRNFNRALRYCTGQYIVIADGDDISKADRLSSIADEISRSHRSLYISSVVDLASNSPHPGSAKFRNESFGVEAMGKRKGPWPILGAGFAFDAELLAKSGSIDTLYATNHNADHALFWRAMAENGCRTTTKPLVKYRDHTAGISLRRAEAVARDNEDWTTLFQNHLKRACNSLGNAAYAADQFLEAGQSDASLYMRDQAIEQAEAIVQFMCQSMLGETVTTAVLCRNLQQWLHATLRKIKVATNAGHSFASALDSRDCLIWATISEGGKLDVDIIEDLLANTQKSTTTNMAYLRALAQLRRELQNQHTISLTDPAALKQVLTPYIHGNTIAYRGRTWPLSLSGLKRLPKRDYIVACEQLHAGRISRSTRLRITTLLMNGKIGKSRATVLLCGGRLATLRMTTLSLRDRIQLALSI